MKKKKDIALGLKMKVQTLDRDINIEIKKSKQLQDEVSQKINTVRPLVGKPISEDLTMYVQALEMYYSQLDRLMFEKHPKGLDLSRQFHELDKSQSLLYENEMNPMKLQTYIESTLRE
jgi:hypothetical protein